MDYGVAVANKFQLIGLSDDEDPYEILKKEEEALAKKKDDKTKKDVKTEKSKSAKTSKVKKTAVVETKPKGVDQNVNKKDGRCIYLAKIMGIEFDRWPINT